MKALVKIGGSVFDLGAKQVTAVCEDIVKHSQGNQFVIAVGGGPSLDTLKNVRGEIGEEMYQYLSTKAIVINARVLETIIPNSKYIEPIEIPKIESLLTTGILPIVSHIDKSFTQDLPNKNSTTDTHDMAIAEYLHIKDIVFIKDTKGVFDKDPNIHRDAVFFETAKPDDFFSKRINRIGTDGKDKHLIEDDALTLLQRSTLINSISIIDCKDTTALAKWLNNESVGSKIIKG